MYIDCQSTFNRLYAALEGAAIGQELLQCPSLDDVEGLHEIPSTAGIARAVQR